MFAGQLIVAYFKTKHKLALGSFGEDNHWSFNSLGQSEHWHTAQNTVWFTVSFQKNSSHNSCLAIIHKYTMLEETNIK